MLEYNINVGEECLLALHRKETPTYHDDNHHHFAISFVNFSWYFGKISRVETQKQLMSEPNTHGSFLVRESESTVNTYALSIRDQDSVRHYKIKTLDSGGFFISKNHEFDTIQNLVAFYLQQPEGLCCKLLAACIKVSHWISESIISRTSAIVWAILECLSLILQTWSFQPRIGVSAMKNSWKGQRTEQMGGF